VNGVSDLVFLSVLCNDNRTSLTLLRSTLETIIPETDEEDMDAAVEESVFN
jgi:hypothetical protein